VALFLFSVQSRATVVYVLQTAPGATASSGTGSSPVDARAQVTIDTDHIHIVLLNALTAPANANDLANINGFGLNIKQTINVAINPGGLTSSAIHRTINSSGTYSDQGPSSTAWTVDTLLSQNYNFFLDGRAKPPTNFPKETIVFMPNSGTTYNVNNSISGASHNPYYATDSLSFSDPLNPQWDIQFAPNSGINDKITIQGAGFAFGTATSVFAVAGQITYVSNPEPGSIALLASGLCLIAVGVYRRRRH
jgi:hypothetical protein